MRACGLCVLHFDCPLVGVCPLFMLVRCSQSMQCVTALGNNPAAHARWSISKASASILPRPLHARPPCRLWQPSPSWCPARSATRRPRPVPAPPPRPPTGRRRGAALGWRQARAWLLLPSPAAQAPLQRCQALPTMAAPPPASAPGRQRWGLQRCWILSASWTPRKLSWRWQSRPCNRRRAARASSWSWWRRCSQRRPTWLVSHAPAKCFGAFRVACAMGAGAVPFPCFLQCSIALLLSHANG